MATTERDVLDALHEVIHEGDVRENRQRGKKLYSPLNLPVRLEEYLAEAKLTRPKAAQRFGMSRQTLDSILRGGPLSENMLFRLRNALEYASQHPGISVDHSENVYPGEWRGTRKRLVQDAIGVLTEKLVLLRDAVRESNSIRGPDAPIDELQLAQLIALLEAMLAAITAPYVDAQQTGGFFKWLKKLGKKAAAKGVETGVQHCFEQAVDAGSRFIEALASSSGPSDLGGLTL